MAWAGDVPAACGQLVDSLSHFRPHVLARHAGTVEHELAVDAADESDLPGELPLQPRQVVAGLARVPHVTADLYHVGEDLVNPPAGVLVDHRAAVMDAVVDSFGVRLDDLPPDVRGEEKLVLVAPVVAVPHDVHPAGLFDEPPGELDLVIGDGGDELLHQFLFGQVGHQRLFHAQQQVAPLVQAELHEAALHHVAAGRGVLGDLLPHALPVHGVHIGDGDLLAPLGQVGNGVPAVRRIRAALGAGLERPLHAEVVLDRLARALRHRRGERNAGDVRGHPLRVVVVYRAKVVFLGRHWYPLVQAGRSEPGCEALA